MISTNLNQSQFFERLEKDTLQQGNFIVISKIVIDSSTIKWDFRTIKNVTFKSSINFSNADIKLGFAFINCNFEKGIYFQSISTNSFETESNNVEYNSSRCNLLFNNRK